MTEPTPALPGDLALIEDAIGRELALTVAIELRGATIYVPNLIEFIKFTQGNASAISAPARALERCIGRSAMRRIVKNCCGSWLKIHNIDALARAERDRGIIADYTSGKPVFEIALDNRLAPRRVWEILGKEEPADPQMSLFCSAAHHGGAGYQAQSPQGGNAR